MQEVVNACATMFLVSIYIVTRKWGQNKMSLQNISTLYLVLIKVAWLDFFFWGGGYLPSLSINYVAMSKDVGKRLPQLYYIKMKISYDLGFIAIGVAMAT